MDDDKRLLYDSWVYIDCDCMYIQSSAEYEERAVVNLSENIWSRSWS